MYRKTSFILALLMSQGAIEKAYANLTASSIPCAKPLQFYAGLSGGVNRMTGRHSKNIFSYDADETIDFGNNLGFGDKDAQYSGFVGVEWRIPKTNFFVGSEIHLGRTHTENKFQKIIVDPGAGDQRTISHNLSQSDFLGAVIKAGYSLSSYSGYILLGGEGSTFHNQLAYVPFHPAIPVFLESKKWLKGVLWGVGLEKQINCFRFGIEARFINYTRYKFTYFNQASNDMLNHSFIPRNMRLSLRFSYIF